VKCVECGAETAEASALCARCGAPAVWQPSLTANPAAGGPGDTRVVAAARDARSVPAWVRRGQRYFFVSLIFFLVLYVIGVVGINKTPQRAGLHHPMFSVTVFGFAGALVSLVLFELARNRFSWRQPVAAVITVMFLWALVFAPFLWLALVRRRARDWVVLAIYLAAEAAMVYIISLGYQPGAYGDGSAIAASLLVVAPVHAWVALSPAAGVTPGTTPTRPGLLASAQSPSWTR
jgi:hypothetical protein